MKKGLRFPAFALYGIACLCFALYIFTTFYPRTSLSPVGRLCLLGTTCVFAYFGSFLFAKTTSKESAHRMMKSTFLLFFAIYLFFLVTLVLFDQYFGRTGFSLAGSWRSDTIRNYINNSLNLIPFKTILQYLSAVFHDSDISARAVVTNLFGNLVAFAPFAFFLPLLWNKYASFKQFAITMILIVVAVEITQFLLLTGSCDIDDVILNVAGACICYKLLNIRPIKRIVSKITTL